MDGIPGWYNARDLAELTRLAQLAAAGVIGVAVEFGSYQGRSSVAINGNVGRPLVCIDPWPDEEDYEAFLAHTAGHDLSHHRTGWREWHTSVAPYGIPVAFCHVDALHTREEVADTITAIQPMLAPGGVLCGHDYGWPSGDHRGVTLAVDDHLPGRHVEGSVWSVRG